MSHIKSNWEAIKLRPNQGVLVELIELYEKLYNKHLPQNSPRRTLAQIKAEKTLMWIFCSTRPLRLKELSGLLDEHGEQDAFAVNAQEGILKACRSFLFESEAGVIEFSHSSVKDYLALKLADQVDSFLRHAASSETSQDSILSHAYETSEYLAHARIAEDSITLLLRTNDVKLTSKILVSEPLLQYAAQNWFKHTERAMKRATIQDPLSASIALLFAPDSQQAYENWLHFHDPDNPRNDKRRRRDTDPATMRPGPLYYVLLLGFPTIAERLIASGANVDTIGGNFGNSLQLACYRGYGNVVVHMLSKDARIADRNGIFGTALQAAAAAGNLEIATCLIVEYGADVNAKGGLLGNALQAALGRDSQDIVELLVMHGARFDREGGRIWKQAYCRLDWNRRKVIVDMSIRLQDSVAMPQYLTPDQMRLAAMIQQGQIQRLKEDDRNISKPLTITQRDMLRGLHERVHTDDMHHFGFIKARLPWLGLHQLLIVGHESILVSRAKCLTRIRHTIDTHISRI